MFGKVLVYGSIAGLVVGIPLFGISVAMAGHAPAPYGMVIGYLTMLIALSAIFVAVKRYRDIDRGGVVGFWPALSIGLGISVIAGLFYVLAWEAAMALTDMDFAGSYAKSVIAQQQARGISAQDLAKLTADMEEFKLHYANPLYRVGMTFAEIFPVGVVVSLLSAGLLRNRGFLPLKRAGSSRQRQSSLP